VRDLAVRGAQALREDGRRRHEAIVLAAARDDEAFRGLDGALRALPQAPVTRATGERALGLARELAGERRLPAADYLMPPQLRSAALASFTTTHISSGSAAYWESRACSSPRGASWISA